MELDISNTVSEADVEEAGRIITFLHPNKEPIVDASGKPVTGRILGTYSKTFIAAQRKFNREKKRLGTRLTPEDEDRLTRELWAACVPEWDFTIGGKMAPPAQVFAHKQSIYDQVTTAAVDHEGFFAASSTP